MFKKSTLELVSEPPTIALNKPREAATKMYFSFACYIETREGFSCISIEEQRGKLFEIEAC